MTKITAGDIAKASNLELGESAVFEDGRTIRHLPEDCCKGCVFHNRSECAAMSCKGTFIDDAGDHPYARIRRIKNAVASHIQRLKSGTVTGSMIADLEALLAEDTESAHRFAEEEA